MTKRDKELVDKWEVLGLFERLSENSIKRVLIANVLERTFERFLEQVAPDHIVEDTIVLELNALKMFEEE